MEKLRDKRRYSIVLEPHGSWEKYVVKFKLNKEGKYVYSKVPFRDCKTISDAKNVKYTLSEIDKFVSQEFDNGADLFKKLGLYQQVHNIYIQFSSSGFLQRIYPIYDSAFIDKIPSTRIDIYHTVKEYLNELESNKKLYTRYLKSDIYKTKTVEDLVRELIRVRSYIIKSGGSSESNSYYSEINNELQNELYKYHILRELILAKDKIKDEENLKQDNEKEQSLKEKPKVLIKKPIYPGYEPKEYVQDTLTGWDDIK